MRISRRQVLQAGAALTGAAVLSGCERVVTEVTRRLQPDKFQLPETSDAASGGASGGGGDYHLLSRAAFGHSPWDLAELRSLGHETWLDRQLHPNTIDDSLCTLRARRFESLQLEPGTCYEFKKPVLREEIARHTLLRAVYSRRQLFEVMVHFWSDHFNINIEKGDCIYLKPSDDRLVIRAHALAGPGGFRAMLRASATSPAMLVYLDGKDNQKRRPTDAPNENYARELMELHTMGVNGGYTQRDVFEAARCLTGWRLHDKWRRGIVYFDPALHDDGAKTVLGQTIPAGGGERDLDRLIDVICAHPSTPRFIAAKLVRRFVADDPPSELVSRTAETFRQTDGDIAMTVRTILQSPEFGAAADGKVKTPVRFIASALRTVGADTHAHKPLLQALTSMGQGLFQHPAPDGYPDKADAWASTLLWRWNLAFALSAGELPTVQAPLAQLLKDIDAADGAPDRLFTYLIGRRPNPDEQRVLMDAAGALRKAGAAPTQMIGVVLASPAFQRC